MHKATVLHKIAALMLAFIFWLAFLTVLSGVGVNAYAAESVSNVLDDLRKDSSFNFAEYPENPQDYSLQVIQIAESTDGELLIYVYQPSGTQKDLRASSISIAREPNESTNLKFNNYALEPLSKNGVFFKYKVLYFKLSSADVRYYNISNILRPFDETIDTSPEDGHISEVPNRVAQFWTAQTIDENVTYTLDTTEVIEITQKVVGYCYYEDGLNLGWGAMEGTTKAYFVAFDTDKPIDKLISADLIFSATRAHCKICCNPFHTSHDYLYDFHDPEYIDYGTGVYNTEPLTITDKEYWGNQGGGNIRPAKKFLRKRIRTTSEFIADEHNEDYELVGADKLDGTKWVLNFYEAQDKYKINNVWLSFIPWVTKIPGISDGEAELNNVYDVEILRLEFETDGKVYNLGVVDNKQSPNNEPFNDKRGCNGCSSCAWLGVLPWWAWLLIIFLAPIVICLLYKFLIWLFKLPFRKRRSPEPKPVKPKRNVKRKHRKKPRTKK